MILSNSAYERTDVTEGLPGIPMSLKFKLVDNDGSCASFPYASVYIWHVDKEGIYSGYNNGGTDARGKTFFRGFTAVDERGEVTFKTIFPGKYGNLATHIHYQVFLYNDTSDMAHLTSQFTLPASEVRKVQATNMYPGANAGSNNSQRQITELKGNVTDGYEAFQLVSMRVPS